MASIATLSQHDQARFAAGSETEPAGPPSSNTGVCKPSESHYVDTQPAFPGTATFDWYASTVRIHSEAVLSDLAAALRAERRELPKGLNGYTNQVELRRDGEVVARVLYGGNGGSPHVFATGGQADELAAVLRRLYPDHHGVSRCDVATDFDDGEGTWDGLADFATAFAKAHGVSTSVYGDWLTEGSPDGRTLYLGSRKSAVYLRIYEKGKQLRKMARENGLSPEGFSETLVRVEIQVRPEKQSRTHAAKMEPMEAYGFSKWSQAFASDLFGLDLDRVSIKHVRDSDDVRALFYMREQYGVVMERVVRERYGGDWAAFGQSLAPVSTD